MRRRLLILVLLLFLIVNQEAINQRQRNIDNLRAAIGRGRGQGARAPERRFPAIDVYGQTIPQGDIGFRGATRFSRSQLDDLIAELQPLVIQNRRVRAHADEPTGRLHPTKLSVQNRVMLVLKFLVHASTLADLSQQFGVSVPAVNEELRHGVFAIVETLAYEIRWPSAAQRALLRQILGPEHRFLRAFGSVDGSFTPAPRRPGDFSGHRHMMLRGHQIAADALGYIVHIVAGQIGSRHDAFNYQRSELPEFLAASDANLLADIGYQGCEDLGLILRATPAQIPNPAARRAYNKQHKRRRSRVEQFIGCLKELFRVVGSRWRRSDRQFLSLCVVASACLYNRVKRLRAQ